MEWSLGIRLGNLPEGLNKCFSNTYELSGICMA